jgi:acyl carrier protein
LAGLVDGIAAQRRGREEVETLLRFLGDAHCRGVRVDWERVYAGTGARRVDLPTHAFQRRRYWTSPPTASGDLAGLERVDHPVLSAAVAVAGTGEHVVTGHLSVAAHPWLADHNVLGSTVLPGASLVEMVAAAGLLVGCDTIDELVLAAPLAVDPDTATVVQVTIAAPDDRGGRPVTVHARPDVDGVSWTRHAAGVVTSGGTNQSLRQSEWPPTGATPIPIDDLYHRLADLGYDYGPAFRLITAAWRQDDTVYVDVECPVGDVTGFTVRPTLLDAVFHVAVAAATDLVEAGQVLLPYAFHGACVSGVDASRLRATVRRTDDRLSASITDHGGRAVASIDTVNLVAVSRSRLAALGTRDSLFVVEWQPVEAPTQAPGRLWGVGEPSVDLGADARWFADFADAVDARRGAEESPAAVVLPCRGALDTNGVLRALQDWVRDDAPIPLVVVTEGAVSTGPRDAVCGVDQAPIWGLVRSAQLEYPGRFVLVDTDGNAGLDSAWPGSESQLALRDGVALTPRLRPAVDSSAPAGQWNPNGTVLITGGGGALGIAVARHLVVAHGMRHLLLTGRRTDPPDEVADVIAELSDRGARVRWSGCDVTDASAVARLLDEIDTAHPVTAVVHAAGVLDDGMVASLTRDQVDRVLAPKVEGARHLHELTRDLDLAGFVLFSSVAGTIGAPGQANYAAANASLDALAEHRHARGLPACSIAWGLWDLDAGMAGGLGRTDRERLRRGGLVPMRTTEALGLLDAALSGAYATVVAARIDRAGMRARVSATGTLPSILRGVVPLPDEPGSVAGAAQFAERLAGLSDDERLRVLSDVVRAQVAAVLGHPGPDAVDAESSFLELGFDSLAAVEMRNRVAYATGVSLPATVAFDRPTPTALAAHLASVLATTVTATTFDRVIDDLAAALDAPATTIDDRRAAAARLRRLITTIESEAAHGRGDSDDDIHSATDAELFELLDGELG